MNPDNYKEVIPDFTIPLGNETGQHVVTDREPDLSGPYAKAWRTQPEPEDLRPEKAASIDAWIIESPHFHPFWSCWAVMVCHLRDIPGVGPAIKHYPEAAYEFMIASIDPESGKEVELSAVNTTGIPFLVPFDAIVQFDGVDDDQARLICKSMVEFIIRGMMSPDSDYREMWTEVILKAADGFNRSEEGE